MVSGPKSARSSGTWTSPRATSSAVRTVSIGWPSKKIRPDVGLITPEQARRVVVLPAPLAPTRATISFSFTSRSISWRICRP